MTEKNDFDKMKEQYKKNKFLNPYRMKNMYNMQTVGQIMMNLDKKEVTVRMDNEMGEFVGINNKLPKNYTPKISVRIFFTLWYLFVLHFDNSYSSIIIIN